MFDPECVFFIFGIEAIWKPDYCRVNMKPDAARRRPSDNLQRYTHISHQKTLYQQAGPLSFATDLLLVERGAGILLSDRFFSLVNQLLPSDYALGCIDESLSLDNR